MPRRRRKEAQAADKERRKVMMQDPEPKEEQPWWQMLWERCCCCSEAFKRRRLIESMVDGYLCPERDGHLFKSHTQQGRKPVVRSELPEGSVMLRLDEPIRTPRDEDRLQYRVDTDGKIVEAMFC